MFGATFALSLAVHVGLAVYLLLFVTQRPGAVRQQTTAISVNLETTDVLDAIEVSASQDAASASASAAPGEVEPLPQPAEVVPEALPAQPPEMPNAQEAAEAEPPELRTAEVEPQSELEAEDLPQSEDGLIPPPAETVEAKPEIEPSPVRERQEPRERPDNAERKKRLAEQARKVREDNRKAREKERQAAQSANAARGTGRSQASAGRVSASTGDIRNYGAVVRARIARNKPGGGGRGSVVIALSISTSGSLTYSRIVRSSGSASLDQDALAAVRRAAPFPPPPSGAAPGQLRFTIPFQFR